jgi:hypothetical protein
MKQTAFKVLLIVSVIAFFVSCKKEYSIDTGAGLGGTAKGTLLDSSGNCQNITVYGTYQMDSVLTDSNYIKLSINFTSAGKYKIYSDTTNGFWFLDSSYVVTTGTQIVKVRAHGKPSLPTSTSFTIYFDSSFCNFVVYFLPPITNTDYFPTTIGSNWTYSENGSTTNTLQYTAKNYFLYDQYTNNTYQLFLSDQQDSALYRKDGLGNYFSYAYLDDSTSYPVDYKFLEDNVAVNSTWSSDEVPSLKVGVSTVKFNFTIVGKDISVTLGGNAYTSVIKVQEDMVYKLTSGQSITFISDYAYYAKGIGWVGTEYPSISNTFFLKSYTVY